MYENRSATSAWKNRKTSTHIFWFRTCCPWGWKSLTMIRICRTFSINNSSWVSRLSSAEAILCVYADAARPGTPATRQYLGPTHGRYSRDLVSWARGSAPATLAWWELTEWRRGDATCLSRSAIRRPLWMLIYFQTLKDLVFEILNFYWMLFS